MKRERFLQIWRCGVILLICAALVCAAGAADGSFPAGGGSPSVEALSRIGSRGAEVRSIQKKLKELGYYSGSVDGIYGSKTANAVKAFQKACGLTQDGVAGPKTLLYLGLGGNSGGTQLSSNDVYLIAKVIAAEARGESYTGQVAVGAVIHIPSCKKCGRFS